jgi:hypothetical protein
MMRMVVVVMVVRGRGDIAGIVDKIFKAESRPMLALVPKFEEHLPAPSFV